MTVISLMGQAGLRRSLWASPQTELPVFHVRRGAAQRTSEQSVSDLFRGLSVATGSSR
jgi:hypothetical protein